MTHSTCENKWLAYLEIDCVLRKRRLSWNQGVQAKEQSKSVEDWAWGNFSCRLGVWGVWGGSTAFPAESKMRLGCVSLLTTVNRSYAVNIVEGKQPFYSEMCSTGSVIRPWVES